MNRQIMRVFIIFFVSSIIAAPHAWAENRGEAQKYFQQGKQLVEQARYKEAMQAFKRSYKFYSHPHVLFNMAKCAVWMGNYDLAIHYYRQFIQKVDDVKLRKKAQTELDKLLDQNQKETEVPSEHTPQEIADSFLPQPGEVVDASPLPSEIKAEESHGPTAPSMATGLGSSPKDKKQSDSIMTKSSLNHEPWYADHWGWAITGVGAALLIAGSITYIVGGSIYSDVKNLPSEQDYYDRQDRGDKLRSASYLLFVGGAVAVAGGSIKLYFSQSPSLSKNSAKRFSVPTANLVYHF